MSARAEFEPLSWEEAEENRRETLSENPSPQFYAPTEDQRLAPWSGAQSITAAREQWSPLLQRRDRLQKDIRRGKERLDQVRNELAQSRARLEQWPLFEKQCERNPLFQLLQSVAAKQRVEQFLVVPNKEYEVVDREKQVYFRPAAQ